MSEDRNVKDFWLALALFQQKCSQPQDSKQRRLLCLEFERSCFFNKGISSCQLYYTGHVIIMNMSMWILCPLPSGWPKEFWERKGLSESPSCHKLSLSESPAQNIYIWYHYWLQLDSLPYPYTNMYSFPIQRVIIWGLLNWSPTILLNQSNHLVGPWQQLVTSL